MINCGLAQRNDTCMTSQNQDVSPANDFDDGTDGDSNPFILVWYLQLIYITAFVTMIVVAAGGNIIVVWIVLGHKRMRTVTNYFLVNLAVADILITVFNSTVNCIYAIYNDWWFGRIYCKFAQFIGPCTISTSVFTFMAIAIDRYIVIVHPLRSRLPARGVIGTIAVIWLTSCGITLPYMLFAETYTFSGGRTICYIRWPDTQEITEHPSLNQSAPNRSLSANSTSPDSGSGVIDFAYNLFLLMINYVLPLLVVAISYARVSVELWCGQAIGERSAAHDSSVKSKRKVVKMMVVVVMIFGVCWMPQHAFLIISSRYPAMLHYHWVQPVYLLCYWLAMSNSMYNPIVYCLMNIRFRSGFKYALRWLPCVRWKSSDAAEFWRYASARHSTTEHSRTYTFNTSVSRSGGDIMMKGQSVQRPLINQSRNNSPWLYHERTSVASDF